MPLVFVVDGVVERVSFARYTLEHAGYAVEVFTTAQAFESVETGLPDLFLIAVNLPDGSGIELCRRIQKNHSPSRTPTILVAESREERYRAVVESGADDFIISPFAPGELISCAQTVASRPLSQALSISSSREPDIAIDSSAMRVKVRGIEISTTSLEFHLIDYMARHRGKVFTRDALLDAVWGDLQFLALRSVDACVGRIRRKIEPHPFSPTFLKTIRGIGYKLDATTVWEETPRELCQCVTCSLSRQRSRMPGGMQRRQIAT
jgi:DNA-binding response OmpR family regulator